MTHLQSYLLLLIQKVWIARKRNTTARVSRWFNQHTTFTLSAFCHCWIYSFHDQIISWTSPRTRNNMLFHFSLLSIFYIKLLVEIFDKNEWIIVWSFIFSDLVTVKLLGLNWHIHRVPYKYSWKKRKMQVMPTKKC